MSNTSLAAQAVSAGPQTLAAPSFEGHGWLVVMNMTVMTAAAAIALMALIYIFQMAWRGRADFPRWTPLRVWRLTGSLFAIGIMLRCGVEAASIWGWDAARPTETASFLFAKRLLDPVAVSFGLSGLGVFVLSLPGMIEQLRKQPLPIAMWQSKRILRNMTWLTLLSLTAAIGVVSTR